MDELRKKFIDSLNPEAVSTAQMLCMIGPITTVDAVRVDILKIGKHPNEEIGNSPLYGATEDFLFDLPAEVCKNTIPEEVKETEPKDPPTKKKAKKAK